MNESATNSLFELEEINYQINGHLILRDLSLSINFNGITGILGPSGCGKSTLLHLLNKLISPTQGRILYQHEDIAAIPSRNLRKEIGLVQQSPSLFPGTVLTNINYGPKIWGEDLEQKRIDYLLKSVGLPKNLLHKDVSQLSGGEQQRVNFIRTLANKPKVLLLDEPTSSLDINSEKLIEKSLIDQSKQGTGIIIVTHSLEQAKRITNQVIILKEGHLEQKIPTSTFFKEYDPETIQKMFTMEGGEV